MTVANNKVFALPVWVRFRYHIITRNILYHLELIIHCSSLTKDHPVNLYIYIYLFVATIIYIYISYVYSQSYRCPCLILQCTLNMLRPQSFSCWAIVVLQCWCCFVWCGPHSSFILGRGWSCVPRFFVRSGVMDGTSYLHALTVKIPRHTKTTKNKRDVKLLPKSGYFGCVFTID